MFMVKVYVCRGGPADYVKEWLVCIRHDPYQKGGDRAYVTSSQTSDGFKFKTEAAAEFAAVFVGGEVVPEELCMQEGYKC